MLSEKSKSFVIIALGMVLMSAAFVVDAFTARGVNDAMLYLPLILLTLFLNDSIFPIIAGVITTVLITTGYFISPEGVDPPSSAIANRILSTISCWVIVVLIVYYKRSYNRALFYKERLGVLFEQAQEGILIVTPAERITGINPRIAGMFGYDESELSGMSTDELLPSMWETGEDSFIDLNDSDSFSGQELIFSARRKDGSVFPARVHVWRMDFSGNKYYTFFISDITEIIEQREALERAHEELVAYAEELKNTNTVLEDRVDARTLELRETVEELQTLNKLLQQEIISREEAVLALNESQQLQEAIAENFPNGILAVLDRDFKFVYERGQETKLNGNGTPLGQLFFPLDNKESSEHVRELLNKAFNGEKISFEYREPLNGNYYLFTVAPLPNVQKEISQLLVVSQNITRQKKAEYDIRKALEKEKELHEMKSRFVSTASHEFRTPLAAIVSSASLISMYQTTEDEPKRKKHVNRITSSVNNLTEILNDFLSLGKIGEGKVMHRPSEFNLIDLCDDVREEISGLANAGQKVETRFNVHSADVKLDKLLLRNVLINLLSNALKYSPQQSTVLLDVYQDVRILKITVKDSGIGIPETDQKHLFQTFFRASNVENIKGTGMGLHIVKKYLEIMDGSIEFESRLNEGSSFTVTFKSNVEVPEGVEC
jgi:PAS domain S-box-containing protein